MKAKVKDIYRFAAYTTLNILVMLILLNLILAGYYKLREFDIKNVAKKILNKQSNEILVKYYKNAYSIDEIHKIIKEDYSSLKYQYQPWVEFRDRPFSGQYINIGSDGNRLNYKNQEYDPGKFTIFIFGGSTMRGFLIKDEDTIAAYLEKELPDCQVINFGRDFYFSTQEMLLFLSLLKEGKKPDIAIFLDGLNDTRIITGGGDAPPIAKEIFSSVLLNGFYLNRDIVPILKFCYVLRSAFKHKANAAPPKTENIDTASDRVIKIYRFNKEVIKSIAAKNNIKTFFFFNDS